MPSSPSTTTTSAPLSNASRKSTSDPDQLPSLVSVPDDQDTALSTNAFIGHDNIKKANRPSKHRRHSDVHRTFLEGTSSSRQSSQTGSRRRVSQKSGNGPRRSSTSSDAPPAEGFSDLKESTTPVQQSHHSEAPKASAHARPDYFRSPSTQWPGPILGGFSIPNHSLATNEPEKRMAQRVAHARYLSTMTPPYSPAQYSYEQLPSATTIASPPHRDWQRSQNQEHATVRLSSAAEDPQSPQLRPALSIVDQQGSRWRGFDHLQLHTQSPQRPHSLVSLQHDTRLEGQQQAVREYITSDGQEPLRPSIEGSRFDARFQWWSPHLHHQNNQHQSIVPGAPVEADVDLKHDILNPQIKSKPNSPSASGLTTRPNMALEGYELLATKLADADRTINPMYRSFEALNHRVLLYLQDEICELEESLRGLDEAIAEANRVDTARSKPASRRAEAHLSPSESEPHFMRKFILGEICVKMERYYRVLDAYHNTTKNLERPRTKDVAIYRQWMSENHPIDDAEAAFLQHQQDLVTLPRRKYETFAVTGSAAVVFCLLLSPFAVFAVMPNLLGRIVTVAIITMTEWLIGSVMEIRHVLTVREWITCTGVYTTLMVAIAAISR